VEIIEDMAMERAIETDEATATDWINQQFKGLEENLS
jgi:hypothetical protein